jgi:hypothetical protein
MTFALFDKRRLSPSLGVDLPPQLMQHGQLRDPAGETARSAGRLPQDNAEGAGILSSAGWRQVTARDRR